MMSRRALAVMAGIAVLGVLLATGLWYIGTRSAQNVSEGQTFFPELRKSLNDIRSIEVTSFEESFTISLQDGAWVLHERDNYPTDTRRVRAFLFGTADLKVRSRKTANPDLHEKLELNDPAEEGSRALAVVLRDEAGDARASFIVGSSRASVTAGQSEYFVRLANEEQAWLVEGALDTPRTPPEWLGRDNFLHIARDDIREVRLVHRSARAVEVVREKADEDFRLRGIPPGYQLSNQFSLNDIVDLFVNPVFDEVAKADGMRFGGAKAVMTTFDGLQVVMEQGRGDNKNYIRLQARATPAALKAEAKSKAEAKTKAETKAKNESGDKAEAVGKDDATAEAKNKSDAAAMTDNESAEKTEDAPDAPEVKITPVTDTSTPQTTSDEPPSVSESVTVLNQKWQGWAWQLPSFRLDNLNLQKKQLIEKQGAAGSNANAESQ